jgi:hypothetical protein
MFDDAMDEELTTSEHRDGPLKELQTLPIAFVLWLSTKWSIQISSTSVGNEYPAEGKRDGLDVNDDEEAADEEEEQ